MTASNTPLRTSRWTLCLAFSVAMMTGCGDADTPATGAEEPTPDVEVMGDAEAAEVDVDLPDVAEAPEVLEDDVEATDALSAFPSDLPIITDIKEDVDLSEFFPDVDASGPLPEGDVASPESDAGDAAISEDASLDDAEGDLIDGDTEGDVSDDAGEPDTFLADCENLGVSPNWSGAFDGAIEYHIPEALEELFYPTDGILIVGGSLSFDISCVDSKLIVSGDMDGTANVAGEGDFPFSVGLAGYYNPETGLLNASLVEGMVVLYGLAEIYFSGDFIGTLIDESFDGTWSATYDGTNFPLPPGDVPEADGLGTWTAQADEVE